MQAINETKMKYISVGNKLYEITKISFFYMTVQAHETDLTVNEVPESEVWDIGEFEHYKVRLLNNGGQAEVIDFDDWRDRKK